MRIVVTGAGGFVGRHLCPLLVSAGHEVSAWSHQPLEMDGVQTETFDLTEPAAVAIALRRSRPDGVIHLAAQASVTRSWELLEETLRVNVVGTGMLLKALVEDARSARVVMVGSGQEYGGRDLGRPFREADPLDPATPYAASKVAQEVLGTMAWRAMGLEVVFARPFNHTGPGQSPDYAVAAFCREVARIASGAGEPVLRVGDLDAERDLLDVRDVAAAYLLLLERGVEGEAYNVASGRARRMGDVLDLVLGAAGLSDGVRIESTGPRRGDARRLAGDPAKLARLGWTPAVPIERSIEEMLEDVRGELERRG